jgi:hypothetical protein
MSNIHTVYGDGDAKPATMGRIMVRNMQETRSRPLPLHDDAEIPKSPKELILHLLQVSRP